MVKLKDGSKRLLNANEIECRVGQKSRDGSKYSVLLYKTARTDMAVLDEVFGWENWQSEHYQVKDKDFCRISVRLDDGMWISKSDCGDETNVEAKKGESSDAMKRAGTQFGIGRELYTAPKIWLSSKVDANSLDVEGVGYDIAGRINYLLITGYGENEKESDRRAVYTLSNGRWYYGEIPDSKGNVEPKQEPKKEQVVNSAEDIEEIKQIAEKLKFEGKNIKEILDYYGVEKEEDVAIKLWRAMLAKVRKDT